MNTSRWQWVLIVAVASACSGEAKQKPLTRSPSNDYRTDEPRTADGRPLGADGLNPKDRLAGSAKGTDEGGELGPGWFVEDGKLKYDPERRDDPTSHDDDHSSHKKKAPPRSKPAPPKSAPHPR